MSVAFLFPLLFVLDGAEIIMVAPRLLARFFEVNILNSLSAAFPEAPFKAEETPALEVVGTVTGH